MKIQVGAIAMTSHFFRGFSYKKWALVIALPLAAFVIACETEVAEPTAPTAFMLPEAPVAEEACCGDGTAMPVDPTPVAPDPARGALVFNGQLGNIQVACASCHATGANTLVGPGMMGLGARAGDRVAGLSASEYITQSIRQPAAHIVEGFANLMPAYGEDQIDEFALADLMAYLTDL